MNPLLLTLLEIHGEKPVVAETKAAQAKPLSPINIRAAVRAKAWSHIKGKCTLDELTKFARDLGVGTISVQDAVEYSVNLDARKKHNTQVWKTKNPDRVKLHKRKNKKPSCSLPYAQ